MNDSYYKAKEIIEVKIPNINRQINILIESEKRLSLLSDTYLESPSRIGLDYNTFREVFNIGIHQKQKWLEEIQLSLEEELKQYLK